ncbi:AAA family ATPase [Roseomonas populi]|uniref:AAA family ATPase n=1 Tax=Roseomonas populi TaxID=3121582 RepID=A0ABT1X7M4_9PROT|nr:AAA family ATPase [Roseomonas pecuniae]MCR0983147.1 AAA family ATPase [Roseomonas pecuniae]
MTADKPRRRKTPTRRASSRGKAASAGSADALADVPVDMDWPTYGAPIDVKFIGAGDEAGRSLHRKGSGLRPAAECALLMLRAAVEAQPDFVRRSWEPSAVSVLRVPDAAWGVEVIAAWDVLAEQAMAAGPGDEAASFDAVRLRPAEPPCAGPERGRLRQSVIAALERVRKDGAEDELHLAARAGTPLVAISHHPDGLFHPDLLLAEDQRLVVGRPDGRMLAILARTLAAMEGNLSDALPVVPPEIAKAAETLTPALVLLARRPGQTADGYLRRLAELVRRRDAGARKDPRRSSVTLETLPGLGAAEAWGRSTARDLRAFAEGRLTWSELDRGVVLEGPPGTGKSSFARALANSAGVDFLSTSLAQWQGDRDGHLGTLLAAMRRTFVEARRKSPCVLLIDEIDSVPDRNSVRHRHRDYVVQVVDGLLEQLDGAADREGVLVVGTCNDASGLDHALTRAGRLERVIRIARPDAVALLAIYRVHLAGELADTDLAELAGAAEARRAVGSDVELWCREARRSARAHGRSLSIGDLWAAQGGRPLERDEQTRRRIAIHEAGHAIAFASLGAGVLHRVSVGRTGGADFTEYDPGPIVSRLPVVTAAVAQSLIGALLAGRAAEEEVLGAASAGAGGAPHSDLALATRIACQTIGMLGLDDHPEALVHLGDVDRPGSQERLLADPQFRARVASLLTRSHQEARALVHARRDCLDRIAEVLVEKGDVDADALLRLLEPGHCHATEGTPASPGGSVVTGRKGRSR